MAKTIPSLASILLLTSSTCLLLSGCNKLGYGEIRTAPVGQAGLGAKRQPVLNAPELQKQYSAIQMEAQKKQSQQGQPSRQNRALPAPQFQQQQAMQPTMMMPQQQMPQQPPMQAQPMAAPQSYQLPNNYPITPYSGGSQSYQLPEGSPTSSVPQQAQIQPQQSSYSMPYNYAPDSYFQQGNRVNANAGFAQPVSVTDYYHQDMQQNHGQQTPVVASSWYQQPSAPVGQVNYQALPVTNPAAMYNQQLSYQEEANKVAAYQQHLQNEIIRSTQPQQVSQQAVSAYQPMSAPQAAAYPSIDPYAAELREPEYNNVYYGGTGSAQGGSSSPNFGPNFNAIRPATGSFTNGFGQRASGMLNPVSSEQYIDVPDIRRPLEEPPMLARESQLYGEGYYQENPYQ